VRNAPAVWQGICYHRIESLTQNYPAVREALPRVDEIAGKVGAAAGTVGNILLRSTLGLVGGVASFVFAVLLLVFVLANPRPLVAAYLALAPDRYRAQAHRTIARLMRQMIAWARGRHQWRHHRVVYRRVAVANWRPTGAHVRRVRVSR
jgi:predicted PurR-regulated permease PerM